MADNELLIKINADAQNAKKAFDDVKDKTEELEDQLSKVAKVSAVAFAAFTAEVYASVKAFEASEQATRQLTNALQNQGIYSKQLVDDYREIASEIQRKTGLDDDQVVAAQATIQTFRANKSHKRTYARDRGLCRIYQNRFEYSGAISR